ncbi:MAG: hypothetical protein ACLTSZ_13285 [Lachnospiraceae bacterium]
MRTVRSLRAGAKFKLASRRYNVVLKLQSSRKEQTERSDQILLNSVYGSSSRGWLEQDCSAAMPALNIGGGGIAGRLERRRRSEAPAVPARRPEMRHRSLPYVGGLAAACCWRDCSEYRWWQEGRKKTKINDTKQGIKKARKKAKRERR